LTRPRRYTLTYADVCWRMLAYAGVGGDYARRARWLRRPRRYIRWRALVLLLLLCCRWCTSALLPPRLPRSARNHQLQFANLLLLYWLLLYCCCAAGGAWPPRRHQGCQGEHEHASSRIKSRRDWHSWHSRGSPPPMAHFQKQTVSKATVNQSVKQQ
jgi:hypothetical protein